MVARVFPELVLADHAEVGGPVVDVRGHVRRPDQHQTEAVPLQEEPAAELRRSDARHTGALQQAEAAFQKDASRNGQRDLHRKAPTIWATTCSGGSRRVRDPAAQVTGPAPPQ